MLDMGKEQRQRLMNLLIKLEVRDSGDHEGLYELEERINGFSIPQFGGQEHTDAKTLQHLGWISPRHLGVSLENSWFGEGIYALDLTDDGKAALANWRASNDSSENTPEAGSVSYLSLLGQRGSNNGARVFIGHGRSPIWRELKDFIEDKLSLPVDEFNSVQTAGTSTTGRLIEMLSSAAIAFLVMTGEDEQPTGELRPRENVVHEAGMFQGRLGFERAIVIIEDGCEKFSNNAGLTHIPFPKGRIRAAFQDVREVLEREGLIGAGQ